MKWSSDEFLDEYVGVFFKLMAHGDGYKRATISRKKDSSTV